MDALAAAIDFQQTMVEANRDQPDDKAIVFRIGLHLGDVIVEGDDIYGDDVNVAARLETEAPPGGIIVSRAVREAVQGRLKVNLHAMGELALKNIDRPIRAFRVEWAVEDWPVASAALASPVELAPALTLPDKPSIAVLPFQNMSGDPEQEYFADGMVEEIITALSRFKSLFVVARNSSFTYKGKAVDIKQVGRELGVRYVLEGSVRKATNKVRISGQLIDTATGMHLWADRFDGLLEDVFELQDQVTTNVAGVIAPKLEQAEIERVKRKPIQDVNAYDCFLRGMARIEENTRQSWEEARQLFCRSIELDPNFATPYGLATRCYQVRLNSGWSDDRARDIAETRRLATHASAVGQDDALALTWSGQSLVWVCREYEIGSALVDQALLINPNLAIAWQNRGLVSMWIGEHELAITQLTSSTSFKPIRH